MTWIFRTVRHFVDGTNKYLKLISHFVVFLSLFDDTREIPPELLWA